MFLQKSTVNLLSSVLDTPEFFWDVPDSCQMLYEKVYFDFFLKHTVIVPYSNRLTWWHECRSANIENWRGVLRWVLLLSTSSQHVFQPNEITIVYSLLCIWLMPGFKSCRRCLISGPSSGNYVSLVWLWTKSPPTMLYALTPLLYLSNNMPSLSF